MFYYVYIVTAHHALPLMALRDALYKSTTTTTV